MRRVEFGLRGRPGGFERLNVGFTLPDSGRQPVQFRCVPGGALLERHLVPTALGERRVARLRSRGQRFVPHVEVGPELA